MKKRKIFLIGLDSAPPELVFEEFAEDLPTMNKLVTEGICGKLESCHPPITIPAWTVMATGKSPGSLGLYGFRHRKGYTYNEGWIATSNSVREPAVWDYLARAGRDVCLVGVPPSYPPKPVRGCLVSCFLTPSASKNFTYPPELRDEIEKLVGNYIFDVVFRTEDRDQIVRQLHEMAEKSFTVVRHLTVNKKWDFFMFVDIGVDRVQHAFWKYFDRKHEKYTPGNRYESVVRDYYKLIDDKVGRLLPLIDEDTLVLVVSDHGAKRMKGAFCINEWLIQEGYLSVKEKPEKVTDLEKVPVDWSKTKAWGWGGYYARIFLNVKGREPQGVIEPEDYDAVREELTEKLLNVRDPHGRRMETKVFKPERLYRQCRGDRPDLMVYLDDLYWRSAGTLGHGSLYLSENDTGPDDAVHAQQGILILYDPATKHGKFLRESVDILDVAPTILHLMGLEVPEDMEGKPVEGVEPS